MWKLLEVVNLTLWKLSEYIASQQLVEYQWIENYFHCLQQFLHEIQI